MKILQIVPRYAPAWAYGGPVRITYDLAKELIRRGHSVTVFTSDSLDVTRRASVLEENLEGISVRRFRNPINYLSARLSFLFFYPLGLKKALQTHIRDFDVVHVVEARGPHNRWASKYAVQQGRPLVWSAYGGLAGGAGKRKIYRWLYDRVFNTPKMIQAASGLIAQTRHEAAVYRNIGVKPGRIRLIPLAIDWEQFHHLPARGQFRQGIGVQPKEKMILFVGRIHRTKGLKLLISAFGKVAELFKEARLVIVGWDHGFLREAVSLARDLQLGNRVLFPGAIYGPDRLKAYIDADLFAMTPDVYEETSLAALEACACGTPCVLTEQCEIPGLQEWEAGRIVKCELEQVVQALSQFLQDDSKTKAWGKNARHLASNKFTLQAVAREHELFFQEVCNGGFKD